jgi:hypothetical protein
MNLTNRHTDEYLTPKFAAKRSKRKRNKMTFRQFDAKFLKQSLSPAKKDKQYENNYFEIISSFYGQNNQNERNSKVMNEKETKQAIKKS